jgi:hypothetical protein
VPTLLLLVGCSGVQTRTYSIAVKNDSTKTIIPWLTKNGPEYEPGWRSPEQLAIERPEAGEELSFIPVPPGRIADIKQVTGRFAPGTDAVLRVYVGPTTLDHILAMNRDSIGRVEIVLHPGRNELVVTDDGPNLRIKHYQP